MIRHSQRILRCGAEVGATCSPISRPPTYTDISGFVLGGRAPGSRQASVACWGRSSGCPLSGRDTKIGCLSSLSESLTETLYLTDIANNRYRSVWNG
jgi:hypothetical protein